MSTPPTLLMGYGTLYLFYMLYLYNDVFGRPFVNGSPYAIGPLSVCLSVLSVCNVGVLWPNSWMDQDETWHAGRPRPWPHCVRRGRSSPSPKGHSPPIFGPYLLRPSGCMDQDVTWYGASVSRRRREMYCGHARLYVCVSVSVCARPDAYTIARTRM